MHTWPAIIEGVDGMPISLTFSVDLRLAGPIPYIAKAFTSGVAMRVASKDHG
jgi:hypothetical protein